MGTNGIGGLQKRSYLSVQQTGSLNIRPGAGDVPIGDSPHDED